MNINLSIFRPLCRYIVLPGTLAVTLSACGGGSSSSSNPTPTPTPTPDPEPTVTISGLVTDMPIEGATVQITIDGETFTAPNPTGADGSYQVQVSSDNPDALVLCEAFVPGGPTRFTALLDNFAGLQEQAGDDDTVESSNITNVTTAQFLLTEALAADGSIDDLAELEALTAQVDADDLLELSAAIKVVVDSVSGTELPAEYNNVQELAAAIVDGTSTFITDIEAANPGILDETVAAILADDELTSAFDADGMPGVMVSSAGTDAYVFFADGTGYLAEETANGQEIDETTWAVNAEGELVVTLGGVATNTDTFQLISDASGVLSVALTIQEDVDGQVVEEPTVAATFIHFKFDPTGFTSANAVGSYGEAGDPEFTILLNDGTGYDLNSISGDRNDFFTWVANADGSLTITDDGEVDTGEQTLSDEIVDIYRLDKSTPELINILELEQDLNEPGVIGIEAFPVTYTSDIVEQAAADAANTALLEGKTYVSQDPENRIIATFAGEGVFSDVIQVLEDGQWDTAQEQGEWRVDADGVITIIFGTDAEGELDFTQLTLTTGTLGGEQMSFVDNENGTLDVDRVEPFTVAELADTQWEAFLADGTASGTFLNFNADGSGDYTEDGVVDETFDWVVQADGVLRLDLDDGLGAPPASDFLFKITGSTATNIDVGFYYTENGVVVDDADPEDPAPLYVEFFSLQKQ